MRRRSAFTLIELLVVVAIIGILATVVVISMSTAQAKARDSKRFAEMNSIKTALEIYREEQGDLPKATFSIDQGRAGWEVSYKEPELFMEYLKPQLASTPLDPINRAVSNSMFIHAGDYFYAYHYYYNGIIQCPSEKSYAVLAFKEAETETNRFKSRVTCGDVSIPGGCTGGGIMPNTDTGFLGCRDWGNEFDYSIKIMPK